MGGARSEDRHGASAITFIDLDGDSDMDLYITVLGGDGPVQLNDNFLPAISRSLRVPPLFLLVIYIYFQNLNTALI